MNTAFSIARSGMAAARQMLDTSAHRIANAATPGFQRQAVALPPQGVGGELAESAPMGEPANLAGDLVEQKVALYSFKANLRVLQAQDAVLGSLLDVTA